MSITCPSCSYDNLDDAEFCEVCGTELNTATSVPAPPEPVSNSSPELFPFTPPFEEVDLFPKNEPLTFPTATTARLVAKQANAPQPEFRLDGVALVGVFDPDMGPVDIDLENFAGGETVSRHHGEIYPEAGNWMIKDLGSTNGIFIKPKGQSRFGARITSPTCLNPGDEVAFGKVQFVWADSEF